MGEVELDKLNKQIIIYSHIITYGEAADEQVTQNIRQEIENMWNEPRGVVKLDDSIFHVVFRISSQLKPEITPVEVFSDTNPRNNFFRIEAYAHGNISFVDGLGSNSGYFLFENLYFGSTTAAHEYGHTLGLDHPHHLDIRGKGVPGIMYPRGTLVDPPYQYDARIAAGQKGGTLHPMFRKVLQQDISSLKLQKLPFSNKRFAIIGEFSNIYHPKHIP